MPTREPSSQLQLLSLHLRHFRIHTETWSRREQQSVDTAQSNCSPWSSSSGGWVPPFLGIQRSQQREVKKNIAATFRARKGWVLAMDSPICCLCCPLSASSPLELPPLSMLITGPRNHLAALQPSVRLVYTMMLPFHPRRRCFLPLSLFPGS